MAEEKIPAAPINTIPEVFEDPQVLAREMLIDMPHPESGSVKMVASPLRLSETPVEYARHPPLLGEHTVEVLRELGLGEEEVRRLQRSGVVQD